MYNCTVLPEYKDKRFACQYWWWLDFLPFCPISALFLASCPWTWLMHMAMQPKKHWQCHSGHDYAWKVRKIVLNLQVFGLIIDSTSKYTILATIGVAQPDFGIAAIAVVTPGANNNNRTRKNCVWRQYLTCTGWPKSKFVVSNWPNPKVFFMLKVSFSKNGQKLRILSKSTF